MVAIDSQYLTIAQLATRWGVHPATVRRRLRDRTLSVLRLSHSIVLIPFEAIQKLEEEKTHASAGSTTRNL